MSLTDHSGVGIGRASRVDGLAGSPLRARGGDSPMAGTPGKETAVTAEARRWETSGTAQPVQEDAPVTVESPQVDAPEPHADDAASAPPTDALGVVAGEDGPQAAAPPAASGAGPKPVKDVAGVTATTPEAGLGEMRGARPDRIFMLFGQVRSATAKDVDETRTKQQANPPKQMSTGAPGAGGKSGPTGGTKVAQGPGTETGKVNGDGKAGDAKAKGATAGKPVADPKGGDAKAVDPKAVDPKAVDPKAVDAKAVDAKAVDPKAVDPKTVDAKAVDAKAVDPKAVDPKAVDPKAVDPKAVDPKTVDAKAVDAKAVDAKAVDAKAVDAKAVDAKAALDPKAGVDMNAAADLKAATQKVNVDPQPVAASTAVTPTVGVQQGHAPVLTGGTATPTTETVQQTTGPATPIAGSATPPGEGTQTTGPVTPIAGAATPPGEGTQTGGNSQPTATGKPTADAKTSASPKLVDGPKPSTEETTTHSDAGGPGTKAAPVADKGPKVSEAETQQMASALDQVPTTTKSATLDTDATTRVSMTGDAKGNTAKERAKLDGSLVKLETQGRADCATPMGESTIETTVAVEELTAAPVESAGPAEPQMPTVAAAGVSEEVGLIAQEQQGPEIDAALAKASTDTATERGKRTQEEAKVRAESDAQLRELKTKADADQDAAKSAAQAEVQQQRSEWKAEIDKQGTDARKQADKKIADGMAQVQAEETKANAEAKKHVDEGNRKAEEEKQKGEQEAEATKEEGKKKSSGFFGWLASKAKAAFDGIKRAVSAVIDAARRAVKAVIDAAKQLAMAAIEVARRAITATIKLVGEAVAMIGGALLSAFPEMKARFQNAIRSTVNKAVDAVNKAADGLKQGVQKALDLLGAALDKALQLYEKAINAIVDVAGSVVQGAIKAAQAVADALGTWVKLIKDVVTGPGAWISNLGAAVMDGIKNHLWAAFKTTVTEWFKSKVFELLGVGGIILQLLFDGGLTTENITQMALDALIVAIPVALITILIEKLVAMIVPAAGAVMAIIEGLQAAWGTISRIIAAFSAFIAFLLAVKSGGAGPLFAAVLASASVVVLDFVANWVLRKLAGPARKVGDKLKGMAEKFKGKGKAKAGAKPSKPANDNRAGAAKDKGSDRKPVEKDGHKPTDKHADKNKPADKDKNKPADKDKNKPADKDKKPADKDKEKAEKDKANQKRLDEAVAKLQPKLNALLAKDPSKAQVKTELAKWKVQHRLTALRMDHRGENVTFTAKVNPEKPVAQAVDPGAAALHRAKVNATKRVLEEMQKREGTSELSHEWALEKNRKKKRGLELPTAKEQAQFTKVLQGNKGGTGTVIIGKEGSRVETSFTQMNGNAIFVRGIGTSQQIFTELKAGAARVKMTETEMVKAIAEYSKTGVLDARIRKDEKLRNLIGRELFRQNAVEPARIPTHLADRSGALETATGKGGKIAQLETGADISKVKGERQGAVQGHKTAGVILDREAKHEEPLRQGTIRERTGQMVLKISEQEAKKLSGKLLKDPQKLEEMLYKRIMRVIFGEKV